jgi:hypothetical protein
MHFGKGDHMSYDRVRIINPDGTIAVLDKTHSQMCEMLKPLTAVERRAFWAKQETALPSGHSVYLVREGV